MSLIAYPPVYGAKRVIPLRKAFMRAQSKRKNVKIIKPAERAQAALEELNRQGTKTFRDRGMPEIIREFVKQAAKDCGVSIMLIASDSRRRVAVHARNEVMYLLKASRPHLSMPLIGRWFGRDPTSAQHGIASHAARCGLPKLVGYDLARVRERNAEISARMRPVQSS